MSDNYPVASKAEFTKASAPETTWTLLLALAERRREGIMPTVALGFTLSPNGELLTTAPDDPEARLIWSRQGLTAAHTQDSATHDLIELYAPLFLAGAAGSLVVAHLGQSIDARIATQSGDSCFVTGPENIIHLHRMRALCDAVIVGAGTVAADNPRLTTRLVEGPNPVRVVIDPDRRVSPDHRLFNDGEARSLLVCADDRRAPDDNDATVVGLTRDNAGLSLTDLLATLRSRGLHNLFVEGGGITVSRWMTADLLDRLHVTIAPVFVGDGRPALGLPPAAQMASCLRPPSRVFRLGEDLLWDFDLRQTNRHRARAEHRPLWPCRVL